MESFFHFFFHWFFAVPYRLDHPHTPPRFPRSCSRHSSSTPPHRAMFWANKHQRSTASTTNILCSILALISRAFHLRFQHNFFFIFFFFTWSIFLTHDLPATNWTGWVSHSLGEELPTCTSFVKICEATKTKKRGRGEVGEETGGGAQAIDTRFRCSPQLLLLSLSMLYFISQPNYRTGLTKQQLSMWRLSITRSPHLALLQLTTLSDLSLSVFVSG